jgi:hypothetical protein
VLLAAAAAVAAYLVLSDKKPARTGGQGRAVGGATRIIVSKAGGENAVASLAEALTRVSPGETVVIAEERLTEPPIRVEKARQLKDVTIESGLPGGRPAVIEFSPAAGPAMAAMLAVDTVQDLRLRNVEFDGRGAADVGVQVTGAGLGVVFEGVTVRNVRECGFRLVSAAGDGPHPLTLDRCRVVLGPTTEAGVRLTSTESLPTHDVMIRNSRFEGPGRAGVHIDGSANAIDVIGNRFYKLDAGVSFARPPGGRQVKGQVDKNTFYETEAGFRFHFTPAQAKGRFDVHFRWNYFAHTPALARAEGAGPVPGAHFRDNGHDAVSKQGNVPVAAGRAEGPELPDPDPNGPRFLRFPGGPPMVGANKVAVGADSTPDRRD